MMNRAMHLQFDKHDKMHVMQDEMIIAGLLSHGDLRQRFSQSPSATLFMIPAPDRTQPIAYIDRDEIEIE